MSFEFYDTDDISFYDTDAFEFYDIGEPASYVDTYAPLFIPPNWADQVALRIIWKTSTIRTKTGGETRSALFTRPRRAIRYSILTTGAGEFSLLTRQLYGNLHGVWAVPYWMQGVALTGAVSAGGNTLSVDTANRYFEVGGLCALLVSLDSYEICEIQALDDVSVTVTQGLANNWAQGVMVYPVLKCTLSASQSLAAITNTVAGMAVEFTERLDPYTTPYSAEMDAPEYLSLPVFNFDANWNDKKKITYTHIYEVEQSLGIALGGANQRETTIGFTQDYMFATRDDIARAVAFFNAQKGMWGCFWVSAEHLDVVVTAAINSDDTVISVADFEWETYWGSNRNTGLHLNFRFFDGTEIRRRIVSEPEPGRLELDEPLGVACSAQNVLGLTVSFLYLVRFNIDQLDLEYLTDSVAKASISFVTLPEVEV